MKIDDYKNAWTAFAHNPEGDYSSTDIEAIITQQSKHTSVGLRRYLQFDLLTKAASLIVLVWLSFLIDSTGYINILVIAAGIAGILIARQVMLIRELKWQVDFSLPVQEVIGAVVQQVRANLSIAGFLVGMTNPLFILAGSLMYYFKKYGPVFMRDPEDIIVSIVLMSIGFVIGYVAFEVQQRAELTDLEQSLYLLNDETEASISLIASRKKRRKMIAVALIVVGLALFLFLITLYLGTN